MSDEEYMSDKEYVANIPNLSNKKLIDGLEWCGHDNYYNVMYYPILKEIKKRLSKERKKGVWTHDGSQWENRWLCSECGYKWFLPKEEAKFCPNCGSFNGEEEK